MYNDNEMHLDYHDFHKLCLDALVAYSPGHSNLKYSKVNNKLRVTKFDSIPTHIQNYWQKRNNVHNNEELAIDGFIMSYPDHNEIKCEPPKEYTNMLDMLFPEVIQKEDHAKQLFKMHPDHHYNEEQNHKFTYKSFKEIYEYLKHIGAIADKKQEIYQ